MEPLDEVSDLEGFHHRRGYEAGLEDFRKAPAASEGAHFGFHKAFSVGLELGYYFGVVVYHQESAIKNPEIYNEKTVKQLTKLKNLITSYPLKNDATDITADFSEIQSQYKKLCSILKIKPYSLPDNSITF